MNKMPRYCWAPNCKESTNKMCCNVSFHRFPKVQHVRKLWINATGKQKEPCKSSTLCSKHFRQEDFKETNTKAELKSNAIPSIFATEQTAKRIIVARGHVVLKPHQSKHKNNILRQHVGAKLENQLVNKESMEPIESCFINIGQENALESLAVDASLVAMPLIHTEQISRKRIWRPYHLKQVTADLLASPTKRTMYWSKAMGELESLRKKVKVLQVDKKRLKNRVQNLQSIIEYLGTMETLVSLRKKVRILQLNKKRLTYRVHNLQGVIKLLKSKDLPFENASETITLS